MDGETEAERDNKACLVHTGYGGTAGARPVILDCNLFFSYFTPWLHLHSILYLQ